MLAGGSVSTPQSVWPSTPYSERTDKYREWLRGALPPPTGGTNEQAK